MTRDPSILTQRGELEPLAELFKALGEPSRLRILNLVAHGGEISNGEVEAITGFGASKISRHFAALRAAGLIGQRREGLWIHYSLQPPRGLVSARLLAIVDALPGLYPALEEDLEALRRARGTRSPAAERATQRIAAAHAAGRKARVLFLCQHNSARSQIAEALLRAHAPDLFEVYSAGVQPQRVHPLALQVLREAGVAAGRPRAKSVTELVHRVTFDCVITLCHEVEDECPRIFPGVGRVLHWPFPDAAAVKGTEARLEAFRRVRERIDRRLRDWLQG